MITAIIGANYGDEGKGLAVNYFTQHGKNLVVRHNGGAQSGHTVEVGNKRFVFHEIGSGTFNGAATFWDGTYHPDLYAFRKELSNLKMIDNIEPEIYCDRDALITIIDDIFLNCFRESIQYGNFGSCGMGIWECVCRNNARRGIPIHRVQDLSRDDLYNELWKMRETYSKPRLAQYIQMYGMDPSKTEAALYRDLLYDDNTLYNFVIEIKEAITNIKLVPDLGSIIDKFDNVIFESGQGLMLDGDSDTEHGTPSKTGLFNIVNSLQCAGKHLDEVVYVTRTYLTRHGNGRFVDEVDLQYKDKTNIFNPWQGYMRYGKFDSVCNLENRIKSDCKSYCPDLDPHILVTHSNLSGGKIITVEGDVDIASLDFNKIYVSDNKFTVSDVIHR